MGIFKAIGWVVTGGAIRPTTTRERSRMYQRRANRLLEDQLDVMQNLAQQQVSKPTSDGRRRGPCPYCLELILVGASTCPHCNGTGIGWSSTPDRCPNCIQVIPFGTTTCPHCKKGGLKWPKVSNPVEAEATSSPTHREARPFNKAEFQKNQVHLLSAAEKQTEQARVGLYVREHVVQVEKLLGAGVSTEDFENQIRHLFKLMRDQLSAFSNKWGARAETKELEVTKLAELVFKQTGIKDL
jgi:hypothetical protein